MTTLEIGPGKEIIVADVVRVARGEAKVKLSVKAVQAVRRSRKIVDDMVAEGKVVYGLTTGFGKFKNVTIDQAQTQELQKNLMMSHSVGVGEPMSREAVRASLFVRINSLSKGYSGVRPELLETAIAILNADITPVVPSQGSVGASGDLAPLSHTGLTLMGEGEVFYKGKRMRASAALKIEKIKPFVFSSKEGLAWNNGTSFMLGIASLALDKAMRIADLADIACALTLEGVCGTSDAFRKEIHELRPHEGQVYVAAQIRKYVAGSSLVDSVPGRIQDSYSLRCAPQVHGACRETLAFALKVVATELNSVTDNPLILPQSGEALSGGNFHGEPLAQAADALAIALAEWGNISERRTAKLVDSSTNEGLPMFLVSPEFAGLHSGLMIPQYTAAALVSENKVLAHPASVDSIPTSANQEDHVSMGSISVRKAFEIAKNVENIIAIEFLNALQAIDFRKPKRLGKVTGAAYRLIRREVPFISKDRILYKDMDAVREIITTQAFSKKIIS